MKYLIGIDEGTTGCKVCLFDESGTILASSYREYPSYYPNPGWVEQDILEIRTAVFDSLKETIQKSGVDAKQIEAVGYSNQGITMVLLDKDKNILRDHTIGWQDARNAEVLPELFSKMTQEEYYDRTGMALGAYNTSVLNWLKKHEPEVWSRIDRICSHQDFFLHELGADGYYIDEASANLLCMLNVETGDWDPEAMKLYNVRYEQLPTIVHEAGKVVGTVPPAVAEETGLPVGCKVCVGALDTNCCTLAVGGIRSGVEVMVVGTAGTAVLICEKPVVLMESDELGCLGAAMYAGIGSGVYASCEDAVARGTHIKKEFKPDPATFEAYRDSFKRWTKSYDLLCNSYYGEE